MDANGKVTEATMAPLMAARMSMDFHKEKKGKKREKGNGH